VKIKSFDRKTELMEAALDEFASKSYEDASLNNIIKNAGISKGTFYYHFKDKKELYLSLLQYAADAKLDFLARKLKNYVHNDDLNLFDNLRLQARFGVEFAKEFPRYYLLGLMYLREKGNEIYEAVIERLGDTTDTYYTGLMERAMERGDIKDGISASFAKRILTHLFYRYDELFDINRAEIDFDQMLHDFDVLIDFIQYGMGRR